MKRTLFAGIILAVLGLLILNQLGRLEAPLDRLARIRKNVTMERIHPLPQPRSSITRSPAPPDRSQRLKEFAGQADHVMGGIPLLAPADLFNDYPELETSFLKAKEGQLRLDYGTFFMRAGLSPTQIDRFLEISMDGERDWIALSKEAAARGTELSDSDITHLARERAEARERNMKELLGPAGLALRQKFRDERESRFALMQLMKNSVLEIHPLTRDQIDRLNAAIAQTGSFDEHPLTHSKDFGQTSEKSGLLNPDQQEILELMLDAKQADVIKKLDRQKTQ